MLLLNYFCTIRLLLTFWRQYKSFPIRIQMSSLPVLEWVMSGVHEGRCLSSIPLLAVSISNLFLFSFSPIFFTSLPTCKNFYYSGRCWVSNIDGLCYEETVSREDRAPWGWSPWCSPNTMSCWSFGCASISIGAATGGLIHDGWWATSGCASISSGATTRGGFLRCYPYQHLTTCSAEVRSHLSIDFYLLRDQGSCIDPRWWHTPFLGASRGFQVADNSSESCLNTYPYPFLFTGLCGGCAPWNSFKGGSIRPCWSWCSHLHSRLESL